MVADSNAAEETVAAKADMRQVWALAEISRPMGSDMEFTLLSCDDPAALKHNVNGKSSEAPGGEESRCRDNDAAGGDEPNAKSHTVFNVTSEKNLADNVTKGHLNGADALLRWAASEARSRGKTESSAWIAGPMNVTRSSFDYRIGSLPLGYASTSSPASMNSRRLPLEEKYGDMFTRDTETPQGFKLTSEYTELNGCRDGNSDMTRAFITTTESSTKGT